MSNKMKTLSVIAVLVAFLPISALADHYGRIVASTDSTQRIYDVVDTSVYNPRPAWAVNDDDLLQGLFQPNVAAWQATNQWFVRIPAGVKSGAVYLGGGQGTTDASQYINPDNTDGNGAAIQSPQPSPYYIKAP